MSRTLSDSISNITATRAAAAAKQHLVELEVQLLCRP